MSYRRKAGEDGAPITADAMDEGGEGSDVEDEPDCEA